VRNITVAISFGAEHELSLEKKDTTATSRRPGDDKEDGNVVSSDSSEGMSESHDDAPRVKPLAARISVPQGNNGVFTIGRDVNIRFQHGIVAEAAPTKQQEQQQPEQQPEESAVGRIGIILWGRIVDEHVKEDPGSPALLKRPEKSPDDAADTTSAAAVEETAAVGTETTTGDDTAAAATVAMVE
jgi:hypothetical protein